MFARTLSSLGQAVGWRKKDIEDDPSPETDRRVWVRYPCDVEAACQPANLPEGQRLSARVRDVSRGGIKLTLSCPVAIGAFLSVELPTGLDAPTAVLAYVVRVTPRKDGEWSVGCTFASELTDEDLEPFGARRLKPAPEDQRTWIRFPCHAQATYQPVKAPEGAPVPAKVYNISANGVALVVDQPHELGTLLSLELRDASGEFHLGMLACIVRISARAKPEWVLGCNLIRELTGHELKALLQESAPVS